ncbi:hypothetical protein PROFUN_04135 [Planoprotostelium fungivorum]|uniref:Uncharacterized protein n=1 Tax=Planoprotostelium fungivorum TaxID=1890364 RepID=A0A2P6NJM6_9EUKA|nr:hypothetical protein PROFUN_04135 [Planoprotostelium fungivorum]
MERNSSVHPNPTDDFALERDGETFIPRSKPCSTPGTFAPSLQQQASYHTRKSYLDIYSRRWVTAETALQSVHLFPRICFGLSCWGVGGVKTLKESLSLLSISLRPTTELTVSSYSNRAHFSRDERGEI